ncbi:hypothetical protein BU14_0288s0007 [Porphyra umbilicalis]|uniref:Uncharacterized protein n=1 Tax=Porphyra umbilicalis TaxID=2786 RepID=A0A1X6P1F5_PORUM|nr:hypothetical protein BU14_0288s0007 [Porphyra umbilicalis]|eukprot:OSX74453.1 hypothetical protein BU14_0288s0007 [Porphyra umbilicalis]
MSILASCFGFGSRPRKTALPFRHDPPPADVGVAAGAVGGLPAPPPPQWGPPVVAAAPPANAAVPARTSLPCPARWAPPARALLLPPRQPAAHASPTHPKALAGGRGYPSLHPKAPFSRRGGALPAAAARAAAGWPARRRRAGRRGGERHLFGFWGRAWRRQRRVRDEETRQPENPEVPAPRREQPTAATTGTLSHPPSYMNLADGSPASEAALAALAPSPRAPPAPPPMPLPTRQPL